MENLKELPITGDLRQEILKGAAIVWYRFSGRDWFVLTKSPKGDEWAFKRFETSHVLKNDTMHLMTSYKLTEKKALEEIKEDFYKDKIAFDRETKKAASEPKTSERAKTFNEGELYKMLYIGDSNLKVIWKCKSRTAKMATFQRYNSNEEIKRRIKIDRDGVEYIVNGSYSMAPSMYANKRV